VADCCECGDEPSGFCATELVSYVFRARYWCNIVIKVLVPSHSQFSTYKNILCNIYRQAYEFPTYEMSLMYIINIIICNLPPFLLILPYFYIKLFKLLS
jgi:hypothetical protein